MLRVSLLVLVFLSLLASVAGKKVPDSSFIVELQHFWVNSSITPVPTSVAFQPAARSAAMFSIAVHDALNSIHERYETYQGTLPGVSKKANLKAAAIGVFKTINDDLTATCPAPISGLFMTPAQQQLRSAYIQNQVDAWLSQLYAEDKDQHVDDGYAIGVAAANRMLQSRQNDGIQDARTVANPAVFVPGTTQSWTGAQYSEMTGRVAINLTYAMIADLKPFAALSLDRFIPPPPPAWNSSLYIDSIRLTKLIGSKVSNVRTVGQTEDALYWGAGAPADIRGNQLAQEVVKLVGDQLDLLDAARVFAKLYLVLGDTISTNANAKRFYESWRPFQQIHHGTGGQVPEIDALVDPTWQPFLATPGNSEYPCGHCGGSNAAAESLRLTFGFDEFPRDVYIEPLAAASVPKRFTSFSQVKESVNVGRQAGGMHLYYSVLAGAAGGIQLAQEAEQNFPLSRIPGSD